MLAFITTAAGGCYLTALGTRAPLQVGMTEGEVDVAMGSRFRANLSESGGKERWARDCDVVYVDDPDWLSIRHRYVIHYDRMQRVQSWKRGEIALEGRPWLNSILKSMGW